jgi:adenosylhomocysteine nucleosidase
VRQPAPRRVRVLTLGFVVGLAAEARIAVRFGGLVHSGGGTPQGAELAAARLIGDGATALVSFGLAGGLDPALRPATVVIASDVLSDGERWLVDRPLAARFGGVTGHTMLAGSTVIAEASAKRALWAATGAHAVDLESGAVARVARTYGLGFAVVRAICDPAERTLPPAALVALAPDGGISLLPVLQSVLRRPDQIPGLLGLARDAVRARRALVGVAQSSNRY